MFDNLFCHDDNIILTHIKKSIDNCFFQCIYSWFIESVCWLINRLMNEVSNQFANVICKNARLIVVKKENHHLWKSWRDWKRHCWNFSHWSWQLCFVFRKIHFDLRCFADSVLCESVNNDIFEKSLWLCNKVKIFTRNSLVSNHRLSEMILIETVVED